MAKKDYLRLCIKQGEEKNVAFTIKADGKAMDLSSYTIRLQVKRAPLEKAEPIVLKEVTTVTDISTVGQINQPQQGVVTFHFLKEDTSYPVGEYPLVISLVAPGVDDIISSQCCNKAIYNICEQ